MAVTTTPPERPGANGTLATHVSGSLAHRLNPVPERLGAAQSDAVVDTRTVSALPIFDRELDIDVLPAGVPYGVGEGLLSDPVRGQLHGRRQPRLGVAVHPRLHPGFRPPPGVRPAP